MRNKVQDILRKYVDRIVYTNFWKNVEDIKTAVKEDKILVVLNPEPHDMMHFISNLHSRVQEYGLDRSRVFVFIAESGVESKYSELYKNDVSKMNVFGNINATPLEWTTSLATGGLQITAMEPNHSKVGKLFDFPDIETITENRYVNTPSKIFINLNGQSDRIDRIEILKQFEENDYLKYGYVSRASQDVWLNDPIIFDNCYFMIVGENVPHDNDFLGFTEKTFIPVAYGLPFMILAGQGHLNYIRELGFKTFPDLFDESYDDEFEWRDRLSIIIRELTKIINMNPDERHKLFLSQMDIILHNKEVLLRDEYTMCDGNYKQIKEKLDLCLG
tara:strand:+ start:2459 stop:3451 length:993 start_codon:yes stop_codon:yes gene_type:complete